MVHIILVRLAEIIKRGLARTSIWFKTDLCFLLHYFGIFLQIEPFFHIAHHNTVQLFSWKTIYFIYLFYFKEFHFLYIFNLYWLAVLVLYLLWQLYTKIPKLILSVWNSGLPYSFHYWPYSSVCSYGHGSVDMLAHSAALLGLLICACSFLKLTRWRPCDRGKIFGESQLILSLDLRGKPSP